MKILQVVVAAGMMGFLLLGGAASVRGDEATYSKEAMTNLSGLLKNARTAGFAMEPKTAAMFGGWLAQGKKKGSEEWVTMLIVPNLDPARDYRVVAAGDNDTNDLDVRIVDPAGKVVAEDTTVGRTAVVTFRPARRQEYKIQMRLYDSRDNSICLGAIMRK